MGKNELEALQGDDHAAKTNLPGKPSDCAFIPNSVARTLAAGKVYSEMDLKAALTHWTVAVDNTMQMDIATLRRKLIDEKYPSRSAHGRSYELFADAHASMFTQPASFRAGSEVGKHCH